MFDIEYKGGNAVVITTRKTQVVVDPQVTVVGLKNQKYQGVVEIATEERFLSDAVEAKLLIDGPGEFEIGDVAIKGVRATRHIDTAADEPISTMYRIVIDDVRIAILGNIAPKLSEDQLENIGVVDILVLPVGGGGYTLDATSAASITRSVDPRVVIPIHYADSALQYEVPQDSLDVFTKELGAPVEDGGMKYKVKSSAAIPPVLTVVTVNRS